MSSSYASALAKLDGSLSSVEEQILRLQAGLPVDEQAVAALLRTAYQDSTALRELIFIEQPQAVWIHREHLEQVIAELEAAAELRRNEERRGRLQELAEELAAGAVKHRFQTRTQALDALRQEAIAELRAEAALPEQKKQLPGPGARDWLVWAFNLEDEDAADATVLADLRRDFPALERFTGDMEQSYWAPAHAPEGEDTRGSGPKAQGPTAQGKSSGNGAAAVPAGGMTVMREAVPEPAAPVAVAIVEPVIHSASETPEAKEAIAPVLVTEEESEHESSHDGLFGSFEQATPRRKPMLAWAGAGGFIILSIVFFSVIYHFHGSGSGKPGATVEAAAAKTPPVNESASGSLLHRQPAEGAQDKILISVENCDRAKPGNIECWGYLSNLSDQPSKIALERIDVVDAKGNSVTLDRTRQTAFPTGRDFSVAGGSKVKYSVQMPDKDKEARTLTMYVDLKNPKSLEYTFRNVPVAE